MAAGRAAAAAGAAGGVGLPPRAVAAEGGDAGRAAATGAAIGLAPGWGRATGAVGAVCTRVASATIMFVVGRSVTPLTAVAAGGRGAVRLATGAVRGTGLAGEGSVPDVALGGVEGGSAAAT